MRYGCSRTRSHCSVLSGPGRSQIPLGMPTRPTSCTSAARPSVVAAVVGSPAAPAAATASAATPGECPRSHGDFKSVKSATAPSASSSRSASILRTGGGSAASTRAPGSSPISANHSLPVGHQRVDDRGVVATAAPARQHLDRRRPPHPAGEQLGIPGGGDHADSHRHLLAGQSGRMAPAVPTLERVGQRVADGAVEPEPFGEPGGDLAMPRRAAPTHSRVRQRPGDPSRPAVHGQVLGEMADEVARGLARLSHQDRRHRGVERDLVAAGQQRRLRRIRRAAEEPQQRDVVHARPRGGIQPEGLGDRQRHPARPQPVLQRLAGSQIGRQRQGDRQLRQAPRTGIVGHPSTLSGPGCRPDRPDRVSRGRGAWRWR